MDKNIPDKSNKNNLKPFKNNPKLKKMYAFQRIQLLGGKEDKEKIFRQIDSEIYTFCHMI